MYIEQLGEAGLIQRIKRKIPSDDPSIVLGIGDDAAIIHSSKRDLLLSTDTIREDVHFSRKYYSFYDIGWKSVAVSISDIAAMGGVPKYILLSMAMPDKVSVKEMDRLPRDVGNRIVHFKTRPCPQTWWKVICHCSPPS